MVNNLQVAFDRATRKYFDQSSSDEDPVLLEYPPIEPSSSRSNLSKDKEVKKMKGKDKKHAKQQVPSSDESDNDDEDKSSKVHQKKSKESKHKDDKKGSHTMDKKKEKSTKGVKRKHKDKDKSDRPKSKKMKKDYSDNEIEKFEFDSDRSESEDEKGKVSDVKNMKTIKKNENAKQEKKLKKSENVKDGNAKKKVKSPISEKVVAAIEKSKKIKKNDKFSKTNEKANDKKRKLEESFKKYSDSDSDESVQDLIAEKKTLVATKTDSKKNKNKASENFLKKSPGPSSTPKKTKKVGTVAKTTSKKTVKKSSKNDDVFSMSSESFSRSPSPLPSINSSALTEDLTISMDYDNETNSKKKFDSSFRSDTPEIKDKFDLIKERRNKMNQEKEKEKSKGKDQKKSVSNAKEKNQKLKETIEKLKIKKEKSKSHIELMDEVLGGKTVNKDTSIFDKLKNEDESVKIKGLSKKNHESEGIDEAPMKTKKSKSEKVDSKLNSKKQKRTDKTTTTSSTPGKSKKQNKACLDVLDMETEQTLKDINKWLEHTPRFEYSSASNSPSRYIIDEIDMPSKMDDNDFRKPIPLMPSSPSASHTNFQSPTNTPKDFNLLKESNNNKQTALSQNSTAASTSNKKVGSKEPKRKSLKEKLQQLPRKKEVQRTIDRLQPGKTKGNLLHNIQNINKPEEFFPLGNREKPKEIKNSLIVQTDESSPKLSLGTVLDTQSFNFTENDSKKQENECFEDISTKVETEKEEIKEEDEGANKTEENSELASDDLKDLNEDTKDNHVKAEDKRETKPNLNAWFKAFGVPKKPKKSESQDDSGKSSDNNDSSRTEGNYMPKHQRRLSTGSSISERSSESSPQVGLEERLGAPAPYPSPIGASPIMASPKTEEVQKTSSNFPNGSLRVGFYQDMTSTKSSPEKSCSPREMPSPYGQYSNQHHYAGTSSSSSAGMYGNFYNPESSGKQGQQASYSKPTNSPASYYDQYKQPLSQESDFNNSMSPSTNPNSPYHSQQSSPYQQQPNSPFQSPASGSANNSGGNASNITQAPNSPYSQPNSPYQQSQTQQTPNPTNFHQQSSTSPAVTPQHKTTPQVQTPAFNQTPSFPQVGQNVAFNHQTPEQFSASGVPSCSKPSDWNKSNANTYNLNSPQAPNNFNITSQQGQPTPQTQNPQLNPQNSSQQISQHLMNTENTFSQNQGSYNKIKPNETQSSGTPSTTPLYGTSKLPDLSTGYSGLDMVTKSLSNSAKDNLPSVTNTKPAESSKYLDLSKQQTAHLNHHLSHQSNQYQMFDLSSYSKPSSEFDMSKNKALEMFNRSIPKTNAPVASCGAGPGFWSNSNKPMETPTNFGTHHADSSKIDLSNKSSGNNFHNNSVSHQQPSRSTPSAGMDINYKQPLFNNPASAASSMMDLTAFMRDFRQAEERLSSSFYDKNITPHMFGKNLQQTNSSVALQQMFNNPMTTMAYNREQQNMNLPSYHNRLSSSVQGPMPNSNQTNPQVSEVKSKKQRKKKNASPDLSTTNTHQVQTPTQMQHHQGQTHQHSQHQQQLAHQQSFQSYGGLKIPGSAGTSTDPSAIALKSVVPGSVSCIFSNS